MKRADVNEWLIGVASAGLEACLAEGEAQVALAFLRAWLAREATCSAWVALEPARRMRGSEMAWVAGRGLAEAQAAAFAAVAVLAVAAGSAAAVAVVAGAVAAAGEVATEAMRTPGAAPSTANTQVSAIGGGSSSR